MDRTLRRGGVGADGPRPTVEGAGPADGEFWDCVYVEDDGSARELELDETEYVNSRFDWMDGGRPYIKSAYDDRTPDGRISGFLFRRDFPKGRRVKALSEYKPITEARTAIEIAIPYFIDQLGTRGDAPDTPFAAKFVDGVWEVRGEWSDAGGAFCVRVSAGIGRILSFAPDPIRSFSTPLKGGHWARTPRRGAD